MIIVNLNFSTGDREFHSMEAALDMIHVRLPGFTLIPTLHYPASGPAYWMLAIVVPSTPDSDREGYICIS